LADQRPLSRLTIASTIALGLIVGLFSGWWAITGGMGGESYSGWHGSRVTGSKDADPWLRARVAVSGLLALNRSQAIYFTRKTDDQGEPFSEQCRYRVAGGPLPGKWWSVTVYAADNYLPLNDDKALSFDATEVTADARGQWTAILSPTRPESGAWASTSKAGNFDITLRIYQPEQRAQDDFASITMPQVTKLDCGGKA
jgi:hypothetical protein